MADLELNSIGNGDGTNYLVRDNTKIPRSGGAVLTGTSIGRVDNTRGLDICGGTSFENGGFIALRGKDTDVTGQKGAVVIGTNNGSNNCDMLLKPDGTATWGPKNIAMQEDVVPRSGGAVLTGRVIGRTVNDSELVLQSGSTWDKGANLCVYGAQSPSDSGSVKLQARTSSTVAKDMMLYPDGTWTWQGTAVQLISDQRLKQQITEIDDKLLDAWEDVNLVQFKYNDAVEEKSDNARLHTGYVVQQIDEACQKHDVDISEYGLYCHEIYQEETREVEQADGTKKTEVVRPASEHYSLRYTEALIVECAYLRKKNKDLQEQLNALSERLEKLENR